jgi:hypothetical protein
MKFVGSGPKLPPMKYDAKFTVTDYENISNNEYGGADMGIGMQPSASAVFLG